MADASAPPGAHVPQPADPLPAAPHVAALPWKKVQSNGLQALGSGGPWPGKCVVAPGEGEQEQVLAACVQSGRREGGAGLLIHKPGVPSASGGWTSIPRGALTAAPLLQIASTEQLILAQLPPRGSD